MILIDYWPLYLVCFVIIIGYAALLYRHYLDRQFRLTNLTFVTDSASFFLTVMLVGSLMVVQWSSDGTEPPSVELSPTIESSPTAELAVRLTVSYSTPTSTVVPTATQPEASSTPTAMATSTPAPVPTLVTHVVQPGERLLAIAERYGLTVEALIAANPALDPDRLVIDQVIVIPGPLLALAASPTQALPTVTTPPSPTTVPTATRTPTLRPSPTASATRTTVPSSTRTAVPSATRTRQPTRTPTVAPTRTVARIAAATSTRPPTATATPPAITLLSPEDGARVGGSQRVILSWEGSRPLVDSERYEVEMWLEGQEPQGRLWTEEERWSLPPAYQGRTWFWRVIVVEWDEIGQYIHREALPVSPEWTFVYGE